MANLGKGLTSLGRSIIKGMKSGIMRRMLGLMTQVPSHQFGDRSCGRRVPSFTTKPSSFGEDILWDLSSSRERITVLEQANTSLTSRINHDSVTMGRVACQSLNNLRLLYDVVSLLEQLIHS
jgi:hypothetical protein